MNFCISSGRKKCVLCGRVTPVSIFYARCGKEIYIPVCKTHEHDAKFNIEGGLKHITDTIKHTVVLSSICGYDERKISEYQRKERNENGT